MDGLGRQQPTPPQTTERHVIERPYARPKASARPKHNRFEKLQLPLLLLAGLFGGLLAQTLALGLILLTIYAVFAFIKRIPSRTSFMLALLLLIAISVLFLLKPDIQLSRNFATYSFILLLIGVATLGRESRLPKRQRRRSRY